MGIGACGAVIIDRHGLPLDFQKAKLHKGEIMTCKDGPLMGLKRMDKRKVAMLSTIHDDTLIDKCRRTCKAIGGVEVIRKPLMIKRIMLTSEVLIRLINWSITTVLHITQVNRTNGYPSIFSSLV